MNEQLDILQKLKIMKPYRNSLGQILPFEHEEGFCDNCGTSLALDHICENCGFTKVEEVMKNE